MRPVLFLLFFSIAESCLVVRNVEPPACKCPLLALEEDDLYPILSTHQFYNTVQRFETHTPKLLLDECYASMYCEGKDYLLIYQEMEVNVFKDYSADGICDRKTQKWLVDEGKGKLVTYDRLFGVCVDFAKIRKVTIQPPTCPCWFDTYENSYGFRLLGHYELYLKSIRGYNITKAIPMSDTWNGCVKTWKCSSPDLQMVIFTSEGGDKLPVAGPTTVCNPYTKMWEIAPVPGMIIDSPYYIVTCVNYADPLQMANIPESEICDCKREMLRTVDDPKYTLKNWHLSVGAGNYKCEADVTCENQGFPRVMVNGKYYMDDRVPSGYRSIMGTCDVKTRKWSISFYKGAFIADNIDTFYFSCVYPV